VYHGLLPSRNITLEKFHIFLSTLYFMKELWTKIGVYSLCVMRYMVYLLNGCSTTHSEYNILLSQLLFHVVYPLHGHSLLCMSRCSSVLCPYVLYKVNTKRHAFAVFHG